MLPLRDNIPTSRAPVVTYAFIVANVLIYFLWQRGGISPGPEDTEYMQHLVDWAAIPYEFVNPGDHCELVDPATGAIACEGQPGVTGTAGPQPPTWATPFSSMFMHGSLLHLGGNMLFLWIFGNNVEDSMGPVKFVIFYVLAGLAALALQTLIGVVTDENLAVPTVGASGAIAGVLGAYLVLFPRARVVTVVFIVFFFTILELPALLVLGLWFLQQALFGYFDIAQPSAEGGGVAYFAHIGGFLFGLLTIRTFANRQRPKRPPSPFVPR
ncbi:MAG TPA: rhomboid family intramembrane serine protease [Solirubrobacter sp.]|nr:rhomboid family intramembrane serine protease [Solirubrobacter sp.]